MIFESINQFGLSLRNRLQGFGEKRRREAESMQQKAEFLRDIKQARAELEAARRNYDFAEDGALLEYYIYEIKAAETRLDYYLKRAKAEGMSNDFPLFGSGSGIGRGGESFT